MSHRPSRRGLLTLTVGALSLALAAPAVAATGDSATVSTSTDLSARSLQLDLLDLAGADLQQLTLSPGQASAFRVRVTDTITGSLLDSGDFSVGTTLNNLYAPGGAGGHDYGRRIPSSAVGLSYPGAGGLQLAGGAVDLRPTATLEGTIASLGAQCGTLTGLLELITSLGLTTDQLGLVEDLCAVLGTTGVALPAGTSLPVDLEDVALQLGDIADLPLTLTGASATGPFTNPDFTSGIGAGDPAGAGAVGTSYEVMRGQGLSALPDSLQTAVDTALADAVAGLAGISGDGSGALLSVQQVVDEMIASSDATVAQLGTLLAQLPVASTLDLLSGIVVNLVPADLSTVTSFGAGYEAFPVLTVTPPVGTSGGDYEGTLTATLVQE